MKKILLNGVDGNFGSRAAVLEDSEIGIEAAARAGMDVVCVPDMKQPEAKYANKTTRIDESLLDVLKDFREGILV